MDYIPPVTDEGPNLACTVADVAAIIRARTKDSNGAELGTFTDTTRPTAVQCEEAITHAVTLIHSKVGGVGDGCADLARGAVALGAAAEIELSYFPEQSRSDRSVYQYLQQRYDAALDGLQQCVLGNLPSVEDDGEVAYRYGTLDAVSGVVHDHYTGSRYPKVFPPPEPPHVQPVDDGE
jgi:hypothetical protein